MTNGHNPFRALDGIGCGPNPCEWYCPPPPPECLIIDLLDPSRWTAVSGTWDQATYITSVGYVGYLASPQSVTGNHQARFYLQVDPVADVDVTLMIKYVDDTHYMGLRIVRAANAVCAEISLVENTGSGDSVLQSQIDAVDTIVDVDGYHAIQAYVSWTNNELLGIWYYGWDDPSYVPFFRYRRAVVQSNGGTQVAIKDSAGGVRWNKASTRFDATKHFEFVETQPDPPCPRVTACGIANSGNYPILGTNWTCALDVISGTAVGSGDGIQVSGAGKAWHLSDAAWDPLWEWEAAAQLWTAQRFRLIVASSPTHPLGIWVQVQRRLEGVDVYLDVTAGYDNTILAEDSFRWPLVGDFRYRLILCTQKDLVAFKVTDRADVVYLDYEVPHNVAGGESWGFESDGITDIDWMQAGESANDRNPTPCPLCAGQGPPPPPPPCVIWRKNFPANYPTGFTELSGAWVANSNAITTSDANSMVLYTSAGNPTEWSVHVSHFRFDDQLTPNTYRAYLNASADGSRYLYGEVEWLGSGSATIRFGSHDSEQTIEYPAFIATDLNKLTLCYYDYVLQVEFQSGVAEIVRDNIVVQAPAADRLGGFGTGATVDGVVELEYATYEIHKQPGYEECPECEDQPPPPPDPCLIFADVFPDDWPGNWSGSGDWVSQPGGIWASAPGSVQINSLQNDTPYDVFGVGVSFYEDGYNHYRSLIHSNSSGTSYFYAEIEREYDVFTGNPGLTWLRIGTTDLGVLAEFDMGQLSYPADNQSLTVCYSPSGKLIGEFSGGGLGYRIVADVADNGERHAGIMVGSRNGPYVQWHSATYIRHQQDPPLDECPSCDESDCTRCQPNTLPNQILSTKSGITNAENCPACLSLNGSDILEYVGNCRWEKNHGPIFDNSECGFNSADVIESFELVDYLGSLAGRTIITGVGAWLAEIGTGLDVDCSTINITAGIEFESGLPCGAFNSTVQSVAQ